MPLYEYECGQCYHRFELWQGFDAEPVTICPQCEGGTRRIIHPTPLLFKGGGFYITDSRKGKEPASGKEKQEATPGKEKQKAAPGKEKQETTPGGTEKDK